jgi:NAD(P)H-flavin reductase
MGGSSDLCRLLEPGEPIVLMGPTGMPTATPAGETVVLVGGGLGNAVLFSIGAALRAAGSRVLYFAGYKRIADRFRIADIEAAADTVVWCCDEAPGFEPGRPQDCAFQGNVVQALQAWAQGALGPVARQTTPDPLALPAADRLIVIGSDRMMAAVAQACRSVLAAHLKPGLLAMASVNSPMQCMMKAVCGQCLQPCVDPSTGQVRMVFTCAEQDQPLLEVDFTALAQRLGQNALPEQQTARWIRLCLDAGTATDRAESPPSGAP